MDFNTNLFRRPAQSWPTHQLISIYTETSFKSMLAIRSREINCTLNSNIYIRACKAVRATYAECSPNCLHNVSRMYFRLCLHVDTSSFRLFKVARCGFVIRCFSAVHKPNRLVVLEYGFALARILHVIVKALFFARSAHKCLLSSVSFFRFSCLNDI